MSYLQAIVLGTVQGLSEFLPISSSAHLVLIPRLFGWPDQGLLFDVFMHAGSLLALCFYFRKDLVLLLRAWLPHRPAETALRQQGSMMILATIPVLIAGLLFNDAIGTIFRDISWIGVWFIIVATLLLITEFRIRKRKSNPLSALTAKNALIIGLAQAAALLPGVSRSGMTIWTGSLLWS
ncbi:MAG TPA: undecaprenyl-diphosphate phosphatase [bacterium]|nr:undecaprenyl-diphosphate phosphatase [bacterium]